MSDLAELDTPNLQFSSEKIFPPSWQGLRQQILYLAQFGSSVQVIHAADGGGKTTFYEHLQDTGLGSTTIGVTVREGAGLAAFFRDLLLELGLRPDPRATLGELAAALRGYVQTLHRQRSRAVLLVDDAHYLTDSELGALVSTLQGQTDAGVGLHVVLFAEPGLAARIDDLQVLDVAVHDAPLPLFSPAEVQELLRLHAQDEGSVGSEQAQRIWYQSKGLPGAALSSFERVRPAPASEAKQALSLRGLPVGHIAALVVLCAVLVWAFLVRDTGEPHQDETLPLVLDLPVPQPASAAPVDTQSVGADLPSQAASAEVLLAERDLVAPVESPDAVLPAVAAEVTPNEAGANFEQQAQREEQREVRARVTELEQPNTNGPVVDATTAAPKAVDQAASAIDPVRTPSAQQSKTLADQGESRLLSYPGNAFVLQLMAASDEAKLAAYVAQQPNRGNLHVYRAERDGRKLFILVEGYYADKASAQAAVVNLPAAQQRGGPWPKSVDQIHLEIRKNR